MKDDQPLNPVLNPELMRGKTIHGKPQRITGANVQNIAKPHSSARVVRNFKSPIKVVRNEDI